MAVLDAIGIPGQAFPPAGNTTQEVSQLIQIIKIMCSGLIIPDMGDTSALWSSTISSTKSKSKNTSSLTSTELMTDSMSSQEINMMNTIHMLPVKIMSRRTSLVIPPGIRSTC